VAGSRGEYGDRNVRPGWVDEEATGHNFAATLAGVEIETLGAMSITEHDNGECDFCDVVRAEVARRLEEDGDGADDRVGGSQGQARSRRRVGFQSPSDKSGG
jgi:hypothetical protein